MQLYFCMPFSCIFYRHSVSHAFCVTVIGLDELEEEHCRLWASEVTDLKKNSKLLSPIVPKRSPFSGNTILAKLISSCVTHY